MLVSVSEKTILMYIFDAFPDVPLAVREHYKLTSTLLKSANTP